MIIGHDTDFIYFKTTAQKGILLGGHYNQTKKQWRLPISLEAVLDLQRYFDITKLKTLKEKLEGYRSWLKLVKKLEPENADDRLRTYQAIDANFLSSRKYAAVFNEQRTGKTPTTLLAVKSKLKKGVIVCPSGLKLNWQREIKVWLGKESVVIKGTPAVRKSLYEAFNSQDDAIIIVSYETLRSDIGTIFNPKNIDVLIVDEAHRLRNYKTKQSKALFELRKHCDNVYALTGTPAVNHPSDVFGILKLLRPKKFTSYWQFTERYFKVVEGHFGKDVYGLREERMEEFTNLLADISVNRKRMEVMQWIPKVDNLSIELEMDSTQEKHYTKAVRELLYEVAGDSVDIPNSLALLTRLRQICVDPHLLGLTGNSPKTEFIKEFLDDNNGSVIIFSSFTSYLNHLASVVDGAALLTGEQSQAQKQEAIDAFQRGERRVLLANIRAGGVGFTLDRADVILFVDRSYNPVDNEQAADRFVPTNPNATYGAKQIIDLVIKGSIEENINKLLKDKQNIISYVNTYTKNALVDLVKTAL